MQMTPSNANTKWQLISYDAIIRSKLLYGLETVQLTEAQQKKIDAFQMRGLRQLMKKKHTYYDRTHTNDHVLKEASKTAYPKGDKQIRRFSEFHEKRKIKLLGHIIRAPNNDPLRQVTFKDNTAERPERGTLRVGRPKQNWIKATKEAVWTTKLLQFTEYKETKQQDKKIYDAAIGRKF
jgi:hypothetical protein